MPGYVILCGIFLYPMIKYKTNRDHFAPAIRRGFYAKDVHGMAHRIMLQGTMSNVGKTLLTAGLCRVLRQDGLRVMPFKAQNMSLNSCVTADGMEMSRAQVLQAEAAGVQPSVDMNPLLLKPTGLTGSQVILQGRVLADMTAREFYRRKAEYLPKILESYRRLEEQADVILIEGAGSPVELNLRKDDLVNMGFAEQVDAPVLLIGDIDPGGVFAQLLGTLELLTEQERARVKGLIVNKFRGDRALFEDGVRILEERSGLPVVGVVPYMELKISDEDSMSDRLKNHGMRRSAQASGEESGGMLFDIAVIRYPRISNFTDFDVFDAWPDMNLRYVTRPEELGRPDLLVLPGSKNTLADLEWLRTSGLERPIRAYSESGIVLGICGGYQMLGEVIEDPEGVEQGGAAKGLGLLPVRTILQPSKVQTLTEGTTGLLKGPLRELSGCIVRGYEIHMGRTVNALGENAPGVNGQGERSGGEKPPWDISEDSCISAKASAGLLSEAGNVYGTYPHGIFDAPEVIPALRSALARQRGITLQESETVDHAAFREREYDRLAEMLRNSLDMKKIYEILG